jgi:hypothetical protein
MSEITRHSGASLGEPRACMSTQSLVLQELAERTGFALLVRTAEKLDHRGVGRAGDNLVHETGVFQALLGIQHATVLREEGAAPW